MHPSMDILLRLISLSQNLNFRHDKLRHTIVSLIGYDMLSGKMQVERQDTLKKHSKSISEG